MKQITVNMEFAAKASEADFGRFEGFCCVYRQKASDRDVIFAETAFDSLISQKQKKPIMLWNHDNSIPSIGVWDNQFSKKEVSNGLFGLYGSGKIITESDFGKQLAYSVKEGAVSGISVGIRVKQHSFDKATGILSIKEAELFEISLCNIPAIPDARTTKAFSEMMGGDEDDDMAKYANLIERCYSESAAWAMGSYTIREFESLLREVNGFSANEAKQAIHYLKSDDRFAASQMKLRDEAFKEAAFAKEFGESIVNQIKL